MKKESVLLCLVILLLGIGSVFVFGVVGGLNFTTLREKPTATVSVAPAEPPAPTPPPAPQNSSIRLRAVGDNLIHDSIYRQANTYANGNGYDFTRTYEHMADLIQEADVAFLNQETIIAEKLYPLSGYPMFNSPEAVGEHMVKLGFDVVSVANNHMFDMKETGLLAALDFWEAQDVTVFGAWRNEAAMQKPILTEHHGITIGWVPMTEHTNGLKLPSTTEVRYILTEELELMKQQIELAKAAADFVIVTPHWGTEYSINANDNQIMLAQYFADWGVDLVIGSHPHTLQPMEWRTGQDGHRMLMTYSLGNFVGSMLYPQNMLGGMLDVVITKDAITGETSITEASLLPTVIHYEGKGGHLRVYPFTEYTQELAASHGIVQLAASYDVAIAPGAFSMDYMRGIIEKNIPEEFRPGLL